MYAYCPIPDHHSPAEMQTQRLRRKVRVAGDLTVLGLALLLTAAVVATSK